MQFHRIRAILLQEFFITKRSMEVLMDLFFFSLMDVVAIGFYSLFLGKTVFGPSAQYLFLGFILWEIVRIAQYSMSVGALWNVWSRNLSNLFITPLSMREYLAAHMLSGALKVVVAVVGIGFISAAFFNFDLRTLGVGNLAFIFVNLLLFAYTTGLVILGLIFRFGTRIQAFAWSLIVLFQPLTAVFFPVAVLPRPLQLLALLLPPTHVFETARRALVDPSFDFANAILVTIWSFVFFLGSLWIFLLFYRAARTSGQFARNEQ